VKLLVISPDYASHALPLVEVARAWRDTIGEAVIATGEATRSLVQSAGVEWAELRLGKGHNAGVIEAAHQPVGEDDHLRAFFDATRAGPVATLLYQADARRHDLLHEPDRVLDRLTEIIAEVQPDRVVVDHVAFGARLALHAMGVVAASVVLGHPSALPAPGEVYGLPPEWPQAMRPTDVDLELVAERCRASVDDLRTAADELIGRRAPRRSPVGDLTSTPGWPTIYAYPQALHDPSRSLPENHVFVGSLARHETLGDSALPQGSGPRVTVALGSFLSARDDVLATAVTAAWRGGWRLALAHGSTPVERLGSLPDGALVERHVPQVALLAHTDVLIHHGGNGSVTEAAAAGVPMVVLPFSTDQFAGAAAIERAGLGRVLPPNGLDADDLVRAVGDVLRSDAGRRAKAVAASIACHGGPLAAVTAIVEHGSLFQ
jgi:MGT family glycosyltransferase